MSSNMNIPSAQTKILSTINQVEGFDPSVFAVEYTDLITGESRKRLPVMAQIAWFRLKYPDGKICVSVSRGNDCFVATAKVYPSYQDAADSYLAEATASRGPDPAKPSVSPREWAQTAAVGIALRNAGFGLQFPAAGEDDSAQVPDELGITAVSGTDTGMLTGKDGTEKNTQVNAEDASATKELSPEQEFLRASAVLCPLRKFAGKTLGEVLNMDPAAISWLAIKYSGDARVAEAAKFICEYAMQQTDA